MSGMIPMEQHYMGMKVQAFHKRGALGTQEARIGRILLFDIIGYDEIRYVRYA